MLRTVLCQPTCPHCGGSNVEGHGYFRLKGGGRQHRELCRNCGRTFCMHTNTPFHYLKKPHLFKRLAKAMTRGISVRHTASLLGVQVATAFRWRHRLLTSFLPQPQPVLEGPIAVGETYVRYSEKGRRTIVASKPATDTARTIRATATELGTPTASSPRAVARVAPVRRFADRKASCVLLAYTDQQQVLMTASRGRPTAAQLQTCLAQVLGHSAEVWAAGLLPYADACRSLGVPHRDSGLPSAADWLRHPLQCVGTLASRLYAWLWLFRGVATRYLENYLAWYRYAHASLRVHSAEAP